jgi:hypothetical protein
MSYTNKDGNRRSSQTATSEHGVNISNTINDFSNDAPEHNNDDTPSSRTSNVFSYDATNSPSIEPSANTNVPSSQEQPTPHPIPMVTTSSQVHSTSIAQDPVIQQLQHSLRLMATRIDTIQETTEHRFTDMQNQYERGQESLQNILKQGLLDMNKHRQEERQMMREIRGYQTQEPPTRSVVVPEARSSTSSLGDPPASIHIHASPTKSPSVQSAPDPPEESQMTSIPAK